ncbi:hypothetical protein [Actinomadura rugatobispora]|uniref:Acyl-CoA dehydrogenase n=1 Tax=Actinomadura rugatobispora TaxID=1994 RepID=A0ABW0ZV01_9ACTN|nr:hypothetical protein GCM10010200_016810 [Actinomadura rugatobispora]
MSAATGTFHLSHPRLYGPAERTVIEPWLTELSHQTMNAYADTAPVQAVAAPAEEAALLALVEELPAARPAARRGVLATAA